MGEDLHVVFVEIDLESWKCRLKRGDGADVVEVGVCEENRRGRQLLFGEESDDAFALLPGINNPRLAVFTQDRAVDLESAYLYRRPFHTCIIT